MGILRKNDIVGLVFSGLFLITVLIIAWIALERIEQQTKANSREALQTVLETTQEALHIWVEQRKRNVRELASLPEVRELTKALLSEPGTGTALIASPYLERFREFMRPQLDLYSDKGFFVIGPDMINIASMRNQNLGEHSLIYQQRPDRMQRLFKGHVNFIPTVRSDVPLRDNHGLLTAETPTIFVGSPVHNENGEVIAALVLRMDPYIHFIRITQLGRIGQTGETYAFDRQGNLITESRFDQQLRRIGLVKPDGSGILQIRISDPGGNLLEGFAAKLPEDKRELTYMARSAIAGRSGFSVSGYRDYRGVPVFGVWLWDSSLDFGLATEINAAEALQPFYATRLVILSVLGLTVVLSFTLSSGLIWVRKQSELSREKAFTELEVRVDERTRELKNARDELQVANTKLAVQATTDPLTGLANRRCFDQHFEEEWSRCQRYRRPLSVIMLDIDHFKAYNDSYGHPVGDECLLRISVVLKGQSIASRPGDMVARYGGEEFIVLLSGTPNKEAVDIAEHICAMIRKEQIPHKASGVTDTNFVTASLGVATEIDCSHATPNSLVIRADKALYTAKAQGRNCVVSFEHERQRAQM
jgi:diguanylate cyclase (GGDEF)-like protein